MDKIFDAIKCQNCQKTLKTPILLPCGHSICKLHSEEQGDQVKCPKCGMSHQNLGFAINTELLTVIESQIASLDFGQCHKEAKDACDKMEDILNQIDRIIKDPICYSHEAIGELKNRVLLKREQFKLEIDEKTERLIAALDEYQHNCELNFIKSSFKSRMKNLAKIRNESDKFFKESTDFLNQFKIDDEKWSNIKQECGCQVEVLNKEFDSFKKQLLMNEFEEKKVEVDFFIEADIDSLFEWEVFGVNSSILDCEKKTQLRDLCKISLQTKSKLLYRGSRDGFGAKDFHSKCDNKGATLTIIETSEGFIFGGFTKQNWNCKQEGFVRDQNAYLFSLVNDLNFPMVMKIKSPEFAINRKKLNGPFFGIHDIAICDNSNISAKNFSSIGFYCLPDNLKNHPNILAGSEYFKVKDIEVFQLELS